jgi:site-specific DNA recombinase
MKTLGYARVSTSQQAVDGVSLDAQKAKITTYCDLHGLALADIEADEGLSGCAVTSRPGLMRVLGLVKVRKIDAVVVYSLSRLVRNTHDALELADLFKSKGVALHSITEKLDTSSALGSFFFTLMSALAELEAATIGERTAFALRHRRAQGFKLGGDVPFGFKAKATPDGIALEPEPREQAIIAKIAAARKRGRSLRTIATDLNRRGIAPREGRWYHQKVARALAGRPG